jgi:hypothetical protein
MAMPASFCPSRYAGGPAKTPGAIATKAYLLDRLVAGSFSDAGALREIGVPLGFTVSCHLISKAHSIVLPATTDPSFATILTAVHATAFPIEEKISEPANRRPPRDLIFFIFGCGELKGFVG